MSHERSPSKCLMTEHNPYTLGSPRFRNISGHTADRRQIITWINKMSANLINNIGNSYDTLLNLISERREKERKERRRKKQYNRPKLHELPHRQPYILTQYGKNKIKRGIAREAPMQQLPNLLLDSIAP